jgi:hypothetical protein
MAADKIQVRRQSLGGHDTGRCFDYEKKKSREERTREEKRKKERRRGKLHLQSRGILKTESK